jgi:hypothetical protein
MNSHSVQSSIDLAVLGPARLDAWTAGEENQKHFLWGFAGIVLDNLLSSLSVSRTSHFW